MAIEIKYSGKNDKKGKCVVTIGGRTEETGIGEDGRIIALAKIKKFENTEEAEKDLTNAYDDALDKCDDSFSLTLDDSASTVEVGEQSSSTPKAPRYHLYVDGIEIYKGSDLAMLWFEITNIPKRKFGP